jgi:transposase-like protein
MSHLSLQHGASSSCRWRRQAIDGGGSLQKSKVVTIKNIEFYVGVMFNLQ